MCIYHLHTSHDAAYVILRSDIVWFSTLTISEITWLFKTWTIMMTQYWHVLTITFKFYPQPQTKTLIDIKPPATSFESSIRQQCKPKLHLLKNLNFYSITLESSYWIICTRLWDLVGRLKGHWRHTQTRKSQVTRTTH